MGTAFSTIRSRVITAVDALSGWTESAVAPELFGRDAKTRMHKSFAVALLDTSTDYQPRDRTNPATVVASTLEVQWAARLTAGEQSTAYGEALDLEEAARDAVLGVSAEDAHITFRRATRSASAAGWVLGVLTFEVRHEVA